MLLINKATDNLKNRMVEACSTDDKSAENWTWEQLWTKCKTLEDFDYQERAGMKFSGPGAKGRVEKLKYSVSLDDWFFDPTFSTTHMVPP